MRSGFRSTVQPHVAADTSKAVDFRMGAQVRDRAIAAWIAAASACWASKLRECIGSTTADPFGSCRTLMIASSSAPPASQWPPTPVISRSCNTRASARLRGESEEPAGEDQTTFVQWDLGFARQDPDLYGSRWKKERSRLLDLIAQADPLTIGNGHERYDIPRVDVPG